MGCKVLILSSAKNFDPLNKYSAISAVSFSIAGLLQSNGYEVWINQWKFKELLSEWLPESSSFSTPSANPIAAFMPGTLKKIIKELLEFNRLRQLENIMSSLPKPDVIIEFLSLGSMVGANLTDKWKIPFVPVFDAPLLEEYHCLFNSKPFFYTKMKSAEIYSTRKATKVLVYSDAMADYVKKHICADADFFIHQLVNFETLNFMESKAPPGKIINIGFIGSFIHWHGIDKLVEAYNRLRAEDYPIKLMLLGGGMHYDEIAESAKKTKFGNDIEFTGYISGSRLNKYIDAIDIGVIPNGLWYQSPVKLFQYGAARIPVIAAGTPAINYICKGNKGVTIFEYGNTDDLCRNLKFLVNNPEKLPELGKLNHDFIYEKYNKNKTLQCYESLFRDIGIMS